KQFARTFVRAIDISLREVQEQYDDHGAGAVSVQATQKGASSNRFGDVRDCGVRVIRGWNVIERQENASDYLRNKYEQETGSENVSETGPAGNRFVERGTKSRVPARAAIKPAPQTRFRRCNITAFDFRLLHPTMFLAQPTASLSDTSCRKY